MRLHLFVSAAALMAAAIPLLAQDPAAAAPNEVSLLGCAVPDPAQVPAGPQRPWCLTARR